MDETHKKDMRQKKQSGDNKLVTFALWQNTGSL